MLSALVFACSNEVPIGDGLGQGQGALGAAGEAPKNDGTCNAGLTACTGTCRNLSSDSSNCGACGTTCAATCTAGKCDAASPTDAGTKDSGSKPIPTCGEGEAYCGGACIDVLFDNANCGACGTKCPAGQKCTRAICM
jgi:hypothetical protein